jgi:DNA-binding LytR/AlgR family response regulator
MEEKVPGRLLIRLRRSYIVNIAQVDEVIAAGKSYLLAQECVKCP